MTATVILKAAMKDKCVPDDFYSTTNHNTEIFYSNRWVKVEKQRMDALIVVTEKGAECRKIRDIKAGDQVVCGSQGTRIHAKDSSAATADEFGFMGNGASSERRNELIIHNLAANLVHGGKRLCVVPGPVVVHTGGDRHLAKLIRKGYVSSVLTGNAVAVHDIEKQFFGTSLGVCSESGETTPEGYYNHMRAINRINCHGSIADAVKNGDLNGGIMHACVVSDVPFVLAGSLRDDGPLPDTITDMLVAQNAYSHHLCAADTVIVLGSMLHGIASGNMTPSRVDMISVDINPAVITKLSDRGSGQAKGIVTDVGLFLNLLLKEVEVLEMEKADSRQIG